MLYHPYSYRSNIDENPIPLQRICVLSYLCLLLTKVLFETSFKSFRYNTEGRRLSNYSIKLILCSHYRARCKGLYQNKKHEFDQYTKGGHFCAAHMALNINKNKTNHQCRATTMNNFMILYAFVNLILSISSNTHNAIGIDRGNVMSAPLWFLKENGSPRLSDSPITTLLSNCM